MDDKTAIDWLSRAAASLGEEADLACDHAISAIDTLAKIRGVCIQYIDGKASAHECMNAIIIREQEGGRP